jgi:hypothetical protein
LNCAPVVGRPHGGVAATPRAGAGAATAARLKRSVTASASNPTIAGGATESGLVPLGQAGQYPSANFASSDIISGDHGGSKTIFGCTLSMP